MCVCVREAVDRRGQQGNKSTKKADPGVRGNLCVCASMVVYGVNGLLGLDLF